ncbi:ABC transporter substrate-binding protein [Acuticoccus kandeliae]|uniref:ABC transporter substrate-binding protein n=1 Tax=Acuticoccus kandeliae TaxID=2073160 RepID=UPI000D3E3903|nr:ABC transporter substrate-binding protein [Acuticoccus kandeliae]
MSLSKKVCRMSNHRVRARRASLLRATIMGVGFAAALVGPTMAQDKTDDLVIVTWGGSLADQMRQVFFAPFAEAAGVTVREDTGPDIQRSRAEVESGSPAYDMTATNLAFYLIGEGQNLWAPIDYSVFDQDALAKIPDEMKLEHGLAAYVYAHGMSFSTAAFPEGGPQPQSWADFWDFEKFPGLRAIAACGSASRPVPEAALLADGVAMDALYPLDIDRAAEKLKELAPNVVWWTNASQPGQMLASGEVVMAMAPTNRIQTLKDEGAPVEIVWNGGQWTYDAWYILKNAPNLANAMDFVASTIAPEKQAAFAKASAMAPTNPDAFALLDEETAAKMPTNPDHMAQMYRKDEAWWTENRDAWSEACLGATLQ